MNYKAFGLILSSSLSLPFIEVSSETVPDCLISIGEVPSPIDIPSLKSLGLCVYVNSENVVVDVEGVARFHCQLNKIIVQTLGACEAGVIAFLVYSALPYWLLLRGQMVLRGCAITWDGVHSQLWLSHSGVGSSTFAAYAVQRGAKLLSDHLCVIGFNEKKISTVQSGISQIKLWQDALNQLQIKSASLAPIRSGLMQFLWDVTENFYHQSLPISQVISLSVSNDVKDNGLKKFLGLEKIKYLSAYNYCHTFGDVLLKKTFQAPLLVALANQVAVYSFTRLSGQKIGDGVNNTMDEIFPFFKESVLA